MRQFACLLFLPVLCLAALCGSVDAQSDKSITIRMIDGRTGLLIATSNFLVRVNHLQEVHGDWVKQNEDGTGSLTLSASAVVVSIHATYDNAMLIYANCDAGKDRGSADHTASPDHWYPVAEILSSGVVAPNNCIGKKVPEKLQVIAKPGEFVFFVRQLSSREQFRD
ncbi:MAG TPA: hypothetical protein VN776_16185 [Terracidiphilus sp.]|nr:hypothetical protein [Terracidiphilus sp.]